MLGRQRVLARTLAGLGAVYAAQSEIVHARESLTEAAQLLTEIAHSHRRGLGSLVGTIVLQPWRRLCATWRTRGRPGLDREGGQVRLERRTLAWVDPELVPLHSLPRFQALQENLKLLPVLDFKTSAERDTFVDRPDGDGERRGR